MKVKRMIKSDVDTFKVGDIIKVKLTDGVKVQAMAMQQEEDGMIFCLVDCLPGEYPMNSTCTNEGGYDKVLITDDTNCPIDENTLLFVDKEPEFGNDGNPLCDYRVRRVAKSLNSISYAISKVTVS